MGIKTCEEEHFSLLQIVVNVYIIPFLCTIGLIENSLMIVILRRNKRRSGQTTTYMLQMIAAADIFYLISSLLILTLDTIAEKMPVGIAKIKPTVWPYLEPYIWPVASVFQTATVWLVVLMTADRYIGVCHPMKAKRISTITRIRIVTALIWMISMLYNMPRFFEQKIVASKGETKAVDWISSNNFYIIIYQNFFFFLIRFIIPFMLLIVFNANILHVIKKSLRFREQHSGIHREKGLKESVKNISINEKPKKSLEGSAKRKIGQSIENCNNSRKNEGTVECCSAVKGEGTVECCSAVKGDGPVECCSAVKGEGTVGCCSAVKGDGPVVCCSVVKGEGTVECCSAVNGNEGFHNVKETCNKDLSSGKFKICSSKHSITLNPQNLKAIQSKSILTSDNVICTSMKSNDVYYKMEKPSNISLEKNNRKETNYENGSTHQILNEQNNIRDDDFRNGFVEQRKETSSVLQADDIILIDTPGDHNNQERDKSIDERDQTKSLHDRNVEDRFDKLGKGNDAFIQDEAQLSAIASGPRSRRKKLSTNMQTRSSRSRSKSSTSTKSRSQSSSRNSSSYQSFTLVIAVLVYVICELPDKVYRILSAMYFYYEEQIDDQSENEFIISNNYSSTDNDTHANTSGTNIIELRTLGNINVISNMLLTVNSMTNFIVYCLMLKWFRRELKELFCKSSKMSSDKHFKFSNSQMTSFTN